MIDLVKKIVCKMGISRVVVKADHIGRIEEEEGMVRVNYRGGQVSIKTKQNHCKPDQSKQKHLAQFCVLFAVNNFNKH